jgi:hypothetical protein
VIDSQSVAIVVALTTTTFALGLLLGFIGAGGAGLVVALLTSVFGLEFHEAIGTALAAMCFVTIAGSISHYREGNIAVTIGVVAGLAGAIGAAIGAAIGQDITARPLQLAAGLALWVLALLVWLRLRLVERAPGAAIVGHGATQGPVRRMIASVGLGLSGGAAAAFFGVGMAPFLQFGLLTVLKLPLRQTVGTTMLTLVFISLSGTLILARHGDVSVPHLIGTVVGLSSGSYLGARYTRRVRREVLRTAVVVVPIVAGAMLIFL